MVEFKRRDAYVSTGIATAFVLLSLTCWRFAGISRTKFESIHGTVVAKVTTPPPIKLPMPLGRYLHVRTRSGEVVAIKVDEVTFAKAAIGSELDRSIFGDVRITRHETPN